MKSIDVTSDSCAEYSEEYNEKDRKFNVGDFVRISKYSNIFAKIYTQNQSEEVSIINKITNTVPWTYAISDLNGEPIARSFYEKQSQKTSQEKLRIEKIIKRKGNKLYAKWKGYDNLFNSWIDKKRPCINMSQYFPKPLISFGGNISVKVYLSNYATETDLKM